MKKIPRPSSTSPLRSHEPLTLPQVTPATVDGDKRPAGADDPAPGPGEVNLIRSLPRSPAQEVGSTRACQGKGKSGPADTGLPSRTEEKRAAQISSAGASSLPVYRCEKGHTEISGLLCSEWVIPRAGDNEYEFAAFWCADCERCVEVTRS
jgi:hypothetical protein